MENEKSQANSEASEYMSVGLESESYEMKDMKDSKLEASFTSAEVASLGPMETHDADTIVNEELEKLSDNDEDEDDDDANNEDNGVRKPFLDKSTLKQVKFNENFDSIEMVPRSSSIGDQQRSNDELEAETLLTATTALTGETGDSATNERSAKRTRRQRMTSYLNTDSELIQSLKPTKIKTLCICITAVVLFLAIFLPNCIFSVYYDKMALARNTLTGVVYTQHTYEPGLHFMMPWNEWILFNRTALVMEINQIDIFTTDKLQVRVWFKLFYFIKREELGKLYLKFGEDFLPIIEMICRSELMILGQRFSIEDYRTKRVHIKKSFRDGLAKRLDTEYSIKLYDLYMERLRFSSRINELNLRRMLNGVYNERATYDKETAITRKDTYLQTQKLHHQAQLELKQAEHEAKNVYRKKATIDYDTKLEKTFIDHLNKTFDGLNFRTANTKDGGRQLMMSYCWYESLLNVKNPANLHFNLFDKKFNMADVNPSLSSMVPGFIGLITS